MLKITKKAELMWYVSTKLVHWHVELSEVREVRDGRRDRTDQTEGAEVETHNATTTMSMLPARHTLPSTEMERLVAP
jgi:hypothetical protein